MDTPTDLTTQLQADAITYLRAGLATARREQLLHQIAGRPVPTTVLQTIRVIEAGLTQLGVR